MSSSENVNLSRNHGLPGEMAGVPGGALDPRDVPFGACSGAGPQAATGGSRGTARLASCCAPGAGLAPRSPSAGPAPARPWPRRRRLLWSPRRRPHPLSSPQRRSHPPRLPQRPPMHVASARPRYKTRCSNSRRWSRTYRPASRNFRRESRCLPCQSRIRGPARPTA